MPSELYPVITELERRAGFRRNDTGEGEFAKFEALLHRLIGDEAITLLNASLSVSTATDARPRTPDLSPPMQPSLSRL